MRSHAAGCHCVHRCENVCVRHVPEGHAAVASGLCNESILGTTSTGSSFLHLITCHALQVYSAEHEAAEISQVQRAAQLKQQFQDKQVA